MNRRIILALLGLALTLGLASPAGAVTLPPVKSTPAAVCAANLAAPGGVLYIGDSITAGYFDAITAQFTAAGHPVCINARPGRPTQEGMDVLRAYKASGVIAPTTTVVMALGSNNTWTPRPGHMTWQVDNAIRVLGTSQPIVWVDVLNWTFNRGLAKQHQYGLNTWAVNREIWARAARYPNIKVAHWNALLRTGNNYHAYTFDGLHTTGAGNTARQNLVLATIG